MSVKISNFSLSLINPIATPAIFSLIGTPAAIIDKLPPQTEAIELDPFDSVISLTTLMEYGNSLRFGTKGLRDLLANAPCPISLLFGPIGIPTSPTL